MSGLISHLAGHAAEDGVLRRYLDQDHRLLARRWRGPAGEIDLVLEQAGQIIFVEVKTSQTVRCAAERLGKRQIARLLRSAEHCLSYFPAQGATSARFDVALVDGSGHIQVIENALAA